MALTLVECEACHRRITIELTSADRHYTCPRRGGGKPAPAWREIETSKGNPQ